MESSFGYKEIRALQDLISSTKDDSDSDEDLRQNDTKKKVPGDITIQKGVPSDYSRPHAPLKGKDDYDIWHPSEASPASVVTSTLDTSDPREVPEYEIKFKQSVKTEDVFLNMGFKTPGTASCEWLSVSIKLPQEVQEKIELSVDPEAIDVRSPRYRLHLPTPHKVDPNASHAKWHGDTHTLELTLRLVRELDDVNF
ncbi:hypothetical protein KPH14_007216 [Odynerus spinipes]|uniref:PIH1D1/2/3 CS-like domain-containing protein n=1 Tax=Odynerus spinipes TaxID=1348599 RepID=A0AAD9RB86_9HYME|nr:hypothetical protein KPH14_007216 [Odynerus spinipes]